MVKALLRMLAVGALLLAGLTVGTGTSQAATGCAGKSIGDGQTRTTCVTRMSLTQGSFTPVWSMSFGGGPGGSNPTCTSQEQRTITKSVSASASADVNFIFGKASASVTGGLSSSVTATFGAAYPFHVPANKTYRCVYGIVTYNFQGTTTTQICGHGSCGAKQAGSFSGTGPQEAKWNYCDIKNTAACSVV